MMKKRVVIGLSCILVVYLLLLIPLAKPPVFQKGETKEFVWNKDDYWRSLEKKFLFNKMKSCQVVEKKVVASLSEVQRIFLESNEALLPNNSSELNDVERHLFNAATGMAACSNLLSLHGKTFWQLRSRIKNMSKNWDMKRTDASTRLYRLLYGSRVAIEQAMLAADTVVDVNSEHQKRNIGVPSTTIHGVEIQSGDLLLSRGTAPTSALIARGNNFPGNFSHVAIVHVSKDGDLKIIESHIEIGVAITDVKGYFEDKKFRITVLRLSDEVEALKNDSMLPHKAASFIFEHAQKGHIPYDFSMDYKNHDTLFCSEVASYAYEKHGVHLWKSLSHIFNPIVANWMREFGVSHFITQSPSDLEYDPQLNLVYEWRSKEGLFDDYVDNAVVDAMIELSEKDESLLPYNLWMLPIARVIKVYSVAKEVFGGVGPVPEGMSAQAALKNQTFQATHAQYKKEVIAKANAFKQKNGYTPPYWQLVRIAKKVIRSN